MKELCKSIIFFSFMLMLFSILQSSSCTGKEKKKKNVIQDEMVFLTQSIAINNVINHESTGS